MHNFSTKQPLFSEDLSINLNGQLLDLSTPAVMGIINATPDSFYDKSRISLPAQVAETAGKMMDQGATIIDLGGASSRPGSGEVPEQVELDRVTPALEAIRQRIPECPVSVDTWRAGVARKLHERFRIDMINDISGGNLDPEMPGTAAELGLPYVIMHMKGRPADMQTAPSYSHVVDEVLQYFGEKVFQLRKLGVNDIILDPGFGFGKTRKQNYRLLDDLGSFRMLGLPIMVGISRKSMISKVTGTGPEEALFGTTALHMAALERGSSILRVHDVLPAVHTIRIYQQVVKSRAGEV